MKYFPLIWAQLFRSRTRTLLTLLSVITAFMLFGMLDAVRVAFNSGGSVDGANRLVVASRLSITQTLPVNLRDRAAPRAVPAEDLFSSEALLKGRREVLIQHGDRIYRLRHTSNDKLILTK